MKASAIKKLTRQNAKISILILALLLVSLLIIYYLGYSKGKLAKDIVVSRSPRPTTEESRSKVDERVTGLNPAIFPSKNREYFFSYYPTNGNTNCKYYITNKVGTHIDLNALDDQDINCGVSMGTVYSSDFKGWINNIEFLLEREEGQLQIFNIKEFTKTNIDYNDKEIAFIAANNNMSKILFKLRSEEDDVVSYRITDKDLNFLQEFDLESTKTDIYPDIINNGVLFINRISKVRNGVDTITGCQENGTQTCECEDCKSTVVNFNYLYFDDLSLRNLLSTSPVIYQGGRGCYPTYVVPVENRIMVYPQCLFSAMEIESYINEDGYINLQL